MSKEIGIIGNVEVGKASQPAQLQVQFLSYPTIQNKCA